jgi:hypothetical protein
VIKSQNKIIYTVVNVYSQKIGITFIRYAHSQMIGITFIRYDHSQKIGITFIRYDHSQKIGKPHKLKLLGSKKTKGLTG